MNNKNYLLTVIFFLSIIGCNHFVGPQGEQGPYDKQVRLEIKINSRGFQDTTWQGENYQGLMKFNVDHFIGVDSVVFICELCTKEDTTKCMARLFNSTDNTPIFSSYIETYSTEYEWVESGNIFQELPKKEITLTIQVKSSNMGSDVTQGWAYLILYRK